MIIPIQSEVRSDLALSVVRLANGKYSVAVCSISNSGSDAMSSDGYYTRRTDPSVDPVVWLEPELGKMEDEDPLFAIKQVLEQVYRNL